MIEIEIGIIYLDELKNDETKELEEQIKIFNDNYLNNYIFCKQYLIFSNIKLTSKEASCLVDIIQTDEGFDLLYGKGIETTYARYIAFKESENKGDKGIKDYIEKVTKMIEVKDVNEINKKYENKVKEVEEYKKEIWERNELLKQYHRLLKDKDKEINALREQVKINI